MAYTLSSSSSRVVITFLLLLGVLLGHFLLELVNDGLGHLFRIGMLFLQPSNAHTLRVCLARGSVRVGLSPKLILSHAQVRWPSLTVAKGQLHLLAKPGK